MKDANHTMILAILNQKPDIRDNRFLKETNEQI
jgi:hypothetical protein